jgi:hypothetical protein
MADHRAAATLKASQARRETDAMSAEKQQPMHDYVRKRYQEAIDYYHRNGRYNKRVYKVTRILTLLFGAVVTLASSLASASFISESIVWDRIFAIGTPILAAALAFLGGFSQTFQWGAAWQDMVLTGERLQKELDRVMVTQPEALDLTAELKLLNDFVIDESRGFFERILGRAKPAQKDQ